MTSDTQFSIDKKTLDLLITSGEYSGTLFKLKNINYVEKVLTYDVEFREFWRNGGEVTHAHEHELQKFIDNEALEVLQRLVVLYATA